jgi:CRP/FNR family transcriptional regulator
MGMLETERFLKVFPFFQKAEESFLEELLSSSEHKRIPGGISIYMEGDNCPGIAFLLTGEIRVFKTGESGREITLYEIFPGETCILNVSCILSNRYYPATAVTLTDAEFLLLPAGLFRSLFDKHSILRDYVFMLLNQRIGLMMELIDEVAFGRMDQRLTDYLIEKSEQGRLNRTHQQIANDLGTSREVISRLLKDLERKGVVRLERGAVQIVHL